MLYAREALRQVLGKDSQVYDYANPDDFRRLWGALNESEPPSGVTTIIWSDVPSDDELAGRGTDSVLTPLAWAVCALKRSQRAGQELRVNVLDLKPQSHSRGSLYSALLAMERNLAPALRILTLHRVNELLRTLVLGDTESDRPTVKAVETLECVLRHELTSPGGEVDRHHVANVVGPVAILGRGSGLPLHGEALLSLLESVGSASLEGGPGGAGGRGQMCVASFPKDIGPIDFILVDDQWKAGWGRVVCAAVGVPFNPSGVSQIGSSDRIRVFASEDATPLVELLESKRPVTELLRNDRGVDADRATVLLLDLRLFEGSPEREVLFLKRLTALAQEVASRNDLPWESFTKKELELYGSLWEEQRRDPQSPNNREEYLRALSVLPRLIALTDSTLPVVLFSSAAQRETLVPITSCGNIITNFKKPRFDGYLSRDYRDAASHSLSVAISRAIHMIEARNFCKAAVHAAHVVRTSSERKEYPFVEVFLDESGHPKDDHVAVGGMLIFYPNREAASRLHASIVDSGKAIGWDCDNLTTSRRDDSVPERLWPKVPATISKQAARQDRLEALKILAKKVQCVQAALVPVCFSWPVWPLVGSCPPLLDPASLDNQRQWLLELVVELVLFEVIPWFSVGSSAGSDVAVYAPTRLLKKEQLHADSADWLYWQTDFGMRLMPQSANKMFTLSTDNPRLFISRMLRDRPKQSAVSIVAARAATLKDFEEWNRLYKERKNRGDSEEKIKQWVAKVDNDLPRQAHYYADFVVRESKNGGSLRECFGTEISVKAATIQPLVDGSRRLHEGLIIDALTKLEASAEALSQFPPIVTRVGDECACLVGPEFIRLSEKMWGIGRLREALGKLVSAGASALPVSGRGERARSVGRGGTSTPGPAVRDKAH